MKRLFSIEDDMTNRISFFHLLLLLVSLAFNMFYSHVILISLVAHTIIHARKGAIRPIFSAGNLVLSSVFLLTLLGTVYAMDKKRAFDELGMQVSIILLPLVLSLNPLRLANYRKQLLVVFSLGSTLVITYLFIHALVVIRFYQLDMYNLFSPSFMNHNFSQPLGIHATYLSMQVALALVCLIAEALMEASRPRRILYMICCVVLTAGIIQLGSKAVFIALFAVINLAIPLFLLKGGRRLKFVLCIVPLSVLMIGCIYAIDHLKSRYVTDLEKDLSNAKGTEVVETRLARWGIAMRIVAGSPVVGYGAGSEVALLKKGYYEGRFYQSYLSGLNAHNQFISFLLKFGVTGLVVFLFTLLFGLRLSIMHNDLLLFAFLFIVAAVCFSENIMDRDKGIYFYSVFFPLLLFSNPGYKNEITT